MKKIFLIVLLFSFFTTIYSEVNKNDFDINLWPLLSYKDNRDGGKDLTALFIFNRKTDGLGRQKELFLFPLFYNFNKPSGNHFGSILFFNGPDYTVVPPLLSGSWQNDSGGRSTWITPLFHSSTDSEGEIKDLHFLTYFFSPGTKILAPIGWSIKTDSGKHHGIIPFYAKGPNYLSVPLALTLSWENYKGDKTTWITPLYHIKKDRSKKLKSFHLLNIYSFKGDYGYHSGFFPLWFKNPNSWLLLPGLSWGYTSWQGDKSTWITPLFHLTIDNKKQFKSAHFLNIYSYKDSDGKHSGIFPLWSKGPDYWYLPPLLSWSVKDSKENRSTWLTPLFHITLSKEKKVNSFHLLNFYAFKQSHDKKMHKGFIPLWFSGPNYWVVPPLLSISWTTKGLNKHTWITPFYHQKRDKDNELQSFHYFNYYGYQSDNGWKKGFAPFFYIGPNYWFSPLLLSGKWIGDNGVKNTWITPLYHKRENKSGKTLDMHFLNYYSFTKNSKKNWSLFPLIFKGEDYWILPPLLSLGWKDVYGGKTSFITPLYHKSIDKEDNISSFHLLNYYMYKNRTGKHNALFPLMFKGDNYLFIPPLLSGGWKNSAGEKSLWITPLFHKSNSKDGKLDSYHFLNFFAEEEEKGWSYNFFPIFKKGPDSWQSPILLSGSWRESNKTHLWITPLFHLSKNDGDGLQSMHIGPYLNLNKNKHILFPLAWYFGKNKSYDKIHFGIFPLFAGGSDYFISPLGYGFGGKDNLHFGLFPIFAKSPKTLIIPPLLTASWMDDNLNKKTWITPLYHKNSSSNGEITSLHLLNYLYTKKFSTLFPIYYSWERDSGRFSSILPPIIGVYKGDKLLDSLLFDFQPITYQRAGKSYEFNLLWRLFHIKKDDGFTEFTLGPLWNSNKPNDGRPMSFQILGGLFAKDVNYIIEQYRYRALWLITLGTWKEY